MALEEEVLKLFADHAPLYLEQLRHAKSTKDWSEAAHTIKGSAAAIGARRLASVAEMVERLDIDSESARSEGFREQAVEAVAGALEEVCRTISRLFAPNRRFPGQGPLGAWRLKSAAAPVTTPAPRSTGIAQARLGRMIAATGDS